MAKYPTVWARPDTCFTALAREQGNQFGALTGELACDRCGMVGLHIEHIDHEPWCRNSERAVPVVVPPRVWLQRDLPDTQTRPVRPSLHGHDPRFESCILAARTRVFFPLDYDDPTGCLDFVGQLIERASAYHERRWQHDYNDLDWRIDDLFPEELNAGRDTQASDADARALAADGGHRSACPRDDCTES